MYGVVFLTWMVMFRTAWGLRVRSCGEKPHAAETLGINVIKIRYQAVILGGFIAGLAGAWFSMESQSGFEDNMTNAAGFIALAAMIFGKWTPWGAFGGALLFGFARALGSRLQFLNVEVGDFGIPSEFFQSMPFVVTLIVVAGALGRAIAPAAEGQPYTPSK
jgi:simple sugar transport system permease protein